ncbi:MarR family winged helix-turn-helix transcriptional regulator [Microbacterium karelineae]|uniref:MarR family winged helix-turn-helix transcriptional regulator n=1 Tax=Microbacterium karelineae TaxID=2654283 RepID=UPI0012E9C9E0|nr:MarR family winged helix-turn-helix transcriptional regulator [Microbacterium karelineae]
MTDAVGEATTSRRVPPGAVTEPLGDALATDEFTPRLLALLSNALVWRESQELRREVGLGTNDWRIVSALATRPGASATEVSEFLGVNKAVVSKSVNTLADRDLIVLGEGPRGSRPMFLTEAGVEMHHVMKPISKRGEDIILEGMTAGESRELNAVLRGMLARLKGADPSV